MEEIIMFDLVPIREEIAIKGFHSIYYFEFDKDFYHPPERHDFWELLYVDDGKINAVVDGIGCMLEKGQVIFHQPMELHSHIANHQDTSNVAVVSFSCCSPLMEYFNKKIFSLEKSSLKIFSLFLAEARDALGQIPGEYENKEALDFSRARTGALQLMQCYLTEFLFSLLRGERAAVSPVEHSPASRQMAENSMVESMERYMQQHLRDTPSLPLLCDHFSMCRTGLCRIFKEENGTSPVHYWIALKIRAAKKMIRQGEENMTQIAEALGFSSIHHFSRMFKRFAGLSPVAYKTSVLSSARMPEGENGAEE